MLRTSEALQTLYDGRRPAPERFGGMSPIAHVGPHLPIEPAAQMKHAGPMVIVEWRVPGTDRASAPCTALIDTGASISVIDETIAACLFGKEAGEEQTVMDPKGISTARLIEVELHVPQVNEISRLKVLTGPLVIQGICGLLGRDFLADKVLIYNGKTGHVTLCR